MTTAGQRFVADLESMVAGTQGRMAALARQAVQQISEEVIYATPVVTGFLRASWQPSLNGPPQKTDGRPSKDTIDADKLADKGGKDIALVIAKMKAGDTFWLVNNAVYGPRIEYGFTGRDSAGREIHQKGRFFVRKTVSRWAEIVRKLAIELKMKPVR